MGLLGATHLEHLMRRLAALATASILALTLAPAAPALAAQGPDGRLRDQAVEAFGSGGAGASADVDRQRHIILDRAGDASDFRRQGKPAAEWRTRLADLRRVAYRTPTAPEGVIEIDATFTQLRGPRAQRAQRFISYVYDPATEDLYVVVVTSRGRAQVFDFSDEDSDGARIRPVVLETTATPGEQGTMSVRLSTEWLDAPVVRFFSLGSFASALDETGATRRLRIGQVS